MGGFMVGIKHQVCEFDINAGRIITMLRTRMGISQQDLGKKLGVTFQQIQKYESGKSRLNAARLNDICRVFEISPAAFYDEINKSYVHDKNMTCLINTVYKLPNDKRKIIFQIATAFHLAG